MLITEIVDHSKCGDFPCVCDPAGDVHDTAIRIKLSFFQSLRETTRMYIKLWRKS